MVLFLWSPKHEGIQRSTFHIIITISLETAAHLLNKCWFSIILCLSWFIPFCIFSLRRIICFSLFVNICRRKKKRGTYILLAFILFPISFLPQEKSWLFLCTCRILHTSGVWHCNICSAICILNDLKFDQEQKATRFCFSTRVPIWGPKLLVKCNVSCI